MTKLKFKKSIISLMVGFVFALCSLPLAAFGSINSASAALTSVYEKPTEVDVNGKFETSGSAIPTKWSLNTKYSNENTTSTSYNGVISTKLSSWDDEYEDIWEDIANILNSSLTLDFSNSDDRQVVLSAITADNTKFNSPLVHDYDPTANISDFKVLMLDSGYSYSPELTGSVALGKVDRTAFVEYKSNSFELEAYSFYRISVWAKTENGAKAYISLGGDIEDIQLTSIDKASSPVEYYFYSVQNGPSSNVQFISTTAPSSSTIEYNGLVYTYDANASAFLPPAGSEAASSKIVYDQKAETASTADWVKYEVYVSTVNAISSTISLSLGKEDLYSTGSVYFDEVKVEKIQLLDFTSAEKNETTAIYDEREILTNKPDSRNYTTVQDFEHGNNWFIVQNDNGNNDVELSTEIEKNETKIYPTFQDSDSDGENEVLKVDNYSTSKAVKVKSPEFTIERFGYYRVSLWGLSMDKDASIVMTLTSHANGKDVTATDKTSPYTKSRTNTGSTSITNYWVEYIFFVKANPLYDTQGTFTIEISKDTIVYFDNLVIEKVTRADYDATKNTVLDLSKTTLTDSITNGRFNQYDSVDYEDYDLPLPPSSWTSIETKTVYTHYLDVANKEFDNAYFAEDLTISADERVITLDGKEFVQSSDKTIYNYTATGEKSQKIVVVKDAEFAYKASEEGFYNEKYDLTINSNVLAGIISGYNNPIISPNGYTENALSIYGPSETTFTYKSAEIKFNKNSVLYSVYVDVLTQGAAIASVKLVDKDGLVYAELDGIKTNDAWQTYTIYVASGLESKSLYLELSLEESSGTVLFKKAIYKQSTSLTALDNKLTQTPEELRADNLAIVDLSKDKFIEHSNKLNNTTNLYDTLLYKQNAIEGSTSGIFGILDTNNAHSDYSNIEPKDNEKSSYVLVIRNDAGESTSIKSLKSITTEKKSATKITIIARAFGLDENKFAAIRFSGVDAEFKISNDEYKEFVLYIDNSEADSAKVINYTVELLGSAGTVVVDSITYAKESSIDSVKTDNENADENFIKIVTTYDEKAVKDEEKTETEAEDENNTLEILMAIISSLLLVAAIVFALLVTRMKAIRKPKSVSKSNKVKSSSNEDHKGFI